MAIFLGHTTALRYWRDMRAHNKFGFPMARSSAQPASTCAPAEQRAAEEAEARLRFCPHGEPLHITVASAKQRRKDKRNIYHRHEAPYPRRAFIVGPGSVCVASPELCFLQMAEELDVVELTLLGLELCGSYSMRLRPEPLGESESEFSFEANSGPAVAWFDEDLEEASVDFRVAKSGFLSNRQPVTSVTQLERFLSKCAGFHGIKKAREALGYVVDNAASPMEARLLMILCFPRAKGGYGLPLPELNRRIDLKPQKGWHPEKRYFKCDFSWGNGLVVEYESDMWHSGKEELEKDSLRRNDLVHMGNTVICITAGQLYSRMKMDKVVGILRKKLGIRVNEPKYDYVARQRELRRILLGVRQ